MGISMILKKKLGACNGTATVKMLNSKTMEIKIAENGEGVENSNYKQLICRWDEFNEIIKKANELGGKMYHGSFDARSGKKLGEGLSEDRLDGFIAENFFNAQKGKSITMRAPYYAAILDWAGIVKNCRSKRGGLGSYIEVNESFRNVLS